MLKETKLDDDAELTGEEPTPKIDNVTFWLDRCPSLPRRYGAEIKRRGGSYSHVRGRRDCRLVTLPLTDAKLLAELCERYWRPGWVSSHCHSLHVTVHASGTGHLMYLNKELASETKIIATIENLMAQRARDDAVNRRLRRFGA